MSNSSLLPIPFRHRLRVNWTRPSSCTWCRSHPRRRPQSTQTIRPRPYSRQTIVYRSQETILSLGHDEALEVPRHADKRTILASTASATKPSPSTPTIITVTSIAPSASPEPEVFFHTRALPKSSSPTTDEVSTRLKSTAATAPWCKALTGECKIRWRCWSWRRGA